MTDASARAWRSDVLERHPEHAVSGALADDRTAGGVIDTVHRLGFAIVTSTAVDGSDERALQRRHDELLAFGRRLGRVVIQSPRCELVEDVRDVSDREPADDRGYRSGGELLPHSDPPTINVLHCIRAARSGGESSLVSVASIVDSIADDDLVAALHEPFPSWQVAGQYGRDEAGPGAPAPVLTTRAGVTSCVLYRPFIELGAAALDTPLTPRQTEALDAFEHASTNPDLTARFTLGPGETLVVHNRTVLHARTDYVDWPELERRRHLLRLWIDAPETFPVAPIHELGDIFAPA